jgi:hypothetical protein
MSLIEKTAWLLFCLTCVTIAFVQPYLFTIYGHQADIYGGLLCALSLLTALLAARSAGVRLKRSYLVMSLALLFLAMISGAYSSTSTSSSIRSFFLISCGLGGFWCSQVLLRNDEGKRVFMWLCVAILLGYLVMSLLTYLVLGKTLHYLIDPNSTTLINRILLLSFGPLALIGSRGRLNAVLGVLLLGFSYVALLVDATTFSRFIHTVSIIVLVSWILVSIFGRLTKLRFALLLLSGMVVMATAVYVFSPVQPKIHTIMNDTRTLYRLENYPFSWHIAREHPVVGIGLETPLKEFLWNYSLRVHRWPSPSFFGQKVARINSPDNSYLAFMVYLGIPFLILYGFALVVLLWKLMRIAWRRPPWFGLPPLAILIPVTAALMHFMDLDGLLFGDINWYFHVLLGLIPANATVRSIK